MGEAGSVAWMFERKGVIEVKGQGLDEDALMSRGLEAGMTDMEPSDEGYTLYSEPSDLHVLKEALEKAKYVVESAESPMVPKTPLEITDVETARKIFRLIDVLEEHDDTQNVYSNFDIPDDVAAQIEE
jgi:transcriptional/translational regulatory protein YebC/TACO1